MSQRLSRRFAALKAEGQAGLITYVMAGDPDAAATLEILRGLPGAGADVIELGFPFSDPMAEGPVIQKAAGRALKGGMTLRGVFDLVRRFREQDSDTPVILMGYLNPVESMGYAVFARAAAGAGCDGLIVVDCPPEESAELGQALEAEGLALIRLATPTTDERRLETVAKGASGFLYYVSVAGVTGVKSAAPGQIAPHVEMLRQGAGLPVAIGFGIREPGQAAAMARVGDAVVVGSALVEAGAQGGGAAVLEKVKALRQAVRNARLA